MMLKYLERGGIKDLGNPQARPMAHGRQKEICARTKHIQGSVSEVDLDG